MPNKQDLLNAAKHFAFSVLGVAAAGVVAHYSNPDALNAVLNKAGFSAALIAAAAPVLHTLLVLVQKTWFNGDEPPAGN
jgi:uncharacterized membrane protein YraQ (UPF0718 family)